MNRVDKKWSHQVTKQSRALDLERGVFTRKDPKQIATSLFESAEKSTRKKRSSGSSAMSMLNFYINRAGTQLTKERRKTLEEVKKELRKLSKSDKRPV